MSNLLFSVFPSENFVDIGLYQYGWNNVNLPILLDLPPETIISFTM